MRERPLQDEFYRLISNIVRDKRFAGLTLSVSMRLHVPPHTQGRDV
ncbi:MAG: hypothetical protein NO515_06675 [Candidatus Methanomethylicia archaeon]|nr:hypothetical protein [Candidatus Methanomethylicia archaeon]